MDKIFRAVTEKENVLFLHRMLATVNSHLLPCIKFYQIYLALVTVLQIIPHHYKACNLKDVSSCKTYGTYESLKDEDNTGLHLLRIF